MDEYSIVSDFRDDGIFVHQKYQIQSQILSGGGDSCQCAAWRSHLAIRKINVVACQIRRVTH